MMRIMTVCVGNICRSPLAEALLRRELPDYTVYSSGLGALVATGQTRCPLKLPPSKVLTCRPTEPNKSMVCCASKAS